MYGYFYGWYLKCQSDEQTLAVIPAVHKTGQKRTCSIQIITDSNVWEAAFDIEVFRKQGRIISIGDNQFGEKGIQLAIHTPGLSAEGKVEFGPLSLLKYDIMGPFALVPFMECRHSIWSMRHLVQGNLCINGQKYSFQNARGYWEGDRGRAFPEKYIWTQCCFEGGSLVLSVADIPLAGIHFTGIIGVVLWQGKEYRFATYLGARVVQAAKGRVKIRQRNLELEARLLEARKRPLKAPMNGNMERIVHESVSCRACYHFSKGGNTLFSFETKLASFEYEYSV